MVANSTNKALVGIVMGSASDAEIMSFARDTLAEFGVNSEMRALSAHRSPEEAIRFAKDARTNGKKVLIAAAGMAAHLAGVTAAHTTLPVIGVPLPGGLNDGLDALLSTVQMPKGTPVGTVAVGKAGAINAALLAIRILALEDPALLTKLEAYQKKLTDDVLSADKKLQNSQ